MENFTSTSNAERSFLYYWTMLNTLPIEDAHSVPVSEYRFDDTRKWRFDFAWPKVKVAVEIDGGVFMGGRHTSGAGYTKDCYKLNRAVELGWRVLRFTPQMLKNDPISVIQQIERVLKNGKMGAG